MNNNSDNEKPKPITQYELDHMWDHIISEKSINCMIIFMNLARLIIFMTIVYFILKYTSDTRLTNRDILIITLLISISFIIMEFYYPNIK